jgi:hypothetical protein
MVLPDYMSSVTLGQPLRPDVNNVNDNVQGPGQLLRPDVNNVNDNVQGCPNLGEDSPVAAVCGGASVCTFDAFEQFSDFLLPKMNPTAFYGTWDERPNHSCRNTNDNTGNFGIHLTNMGTRSSEASANNNARKDAVRSWMDDHYQKNIGSISVCLEANMRVVDKLEEAPVAGPDPPRISSNGKGTLLTDRQTWEHHVCFLPFEGSDTIAIAARKTMFESLETLYAQECHENKKDKANTKILVCKATLRQSIGFLGKELIICGFHGSNKTMKMVRPTEYDAIWKLLADIIRQYGVQVVAGDFNMALLRVPKELSCRGLKCDVLAYYPWAMGSCVPDQNGKYRLGLDSMAIFWIGGDVEAKVNWPESHIERLLDAGQKQIVNDWNMTLDTYDQIGKRPGQPWSCYRCSKKFQEPIDEKDLKAALTDFLRANTSLEEWAARKGAIAQGRQVNWLRFKQKSPDKNAFLVEGDIHNGAHMNLTVFTFNPRSFRSQPQVIDRGSLWSGQPSGLRRAAQTSAATRGRPNGWDCAAWSDNAWGAEWSDNAWGAEWSDNAWGAEWTSKWW